MKVKSFFCVLLPTLVLFSGLVDSHALAWERRGVSDVSLIDTLWPVRVWSIPWMNRSFPCEIFDTDEQGPDCVIKGFAVDEHERLYIMGGTPNVSIACYDGERQVWKRQMSFPLTHSIYGLMKVKGDSIYFFDEERFRLRRMHRDGRGKVDYADLHISKDDSLVWACVYEDRFRLQVVNRREVKYDQSNFVARTRVIDIYLDHRVRRFDERVVSFGGNNRNRMCGGNKAEGDVIEGCEYDYSQYCPKRF